MDKLNVLQRKFQRTDETSTELFGHIKEKRCLGETFRPKNTVPIVKHGGGGIMCTGTLYRRDAVMDFH